MRFEGGWVPGFHWFQGVCIALNCTTWYAWFFQGAVLVWSLMAFDFVFGFDEMIGQIWSSKWKEIIIKNENKKTQMKIKIEKSKTTQNTLNMLAFVLDRWRLWAIQYLPYWNACQCFFIGIIDLWLRWWIICESAIIAAVQGGAGDPVAWLRFHIRRLRENHTTKTCGNGRLSECNENKVKKQN